MTRRRPHFRSFVVAFLCAATPLTAHARSLVRARPPGATTVQAKDAALDKEARRQFDLGEGYFRRGLYQEALRAYKSGYELTQLAGFLINIAHCYTRLGELERARGYYEEYLLRDLVPSPRRARVLEALARLDERLQPRKAKPEDDEAGEDEAEGNAAPPRQMAPPVTLAASNIAAPLLVPATPERVEVVITQPQPPSASGPPTWLWVTALATSVVAAGIAVYAATRSDRIEEGSIGTLGR